MNKSDYDRGHEAGVASMLRQQTRRVVMAFVLGWALGLMSVPAIHLIARLLG